MLYTNRFRKTLYTKTRKYSLDKGYKMPVIELSDIPQYKLVLHDAYATYRTTSYKQNKKALSFNKMKALYGMPNNLNDYFIIKPDHPMASKPKTIQLFNAYKLILILGMKLDLANYFLESLNYQPLSSRAPTNESKLMLYCLRCELTLEEANALFSESGLDALY